MKKIILLMSLVWLLISCGQRTWLTKIETPVPERPKGQTDVLQLTAPPMDTVRVGFIGLGMRGPGAVERFAQIEGTEEDGSLL